MKNLGRITFICAATGVGWIALLSCVAHAADPSLSAEQTLVLTGTLEPFQQTLLFAKVSGYLKRLHVDIGDEVNEGDVIAEILVPEMEPQLYHAQAAVQAAKAHVEKAAADAQVAVSTYRRIADIRTAEPGAVTPQDEDVAKAQQAVAKAQVAVMQTEQKAAEAKVSELRTMMEYATIKAPFAGIITSRLLCTGALVVSGADNGKPLAEITEQDKLRLVVYLPEAAIPYVKVGHLVNIEFDALAKGVIQGKIDRLSQSLAPDTRSMRAEIHLDNVDGSLRPGMFAKVRLQYAPSDK